LSIVPWVLGASWIAVRGLPFSGWYELGWRWGHLAALIQLEKYLAALPVILSPLVLLLAGAGAVTAISPKDKAQGQRRTLMLTIAALAAVWLATRMYMIVFSPRYLLPLLPFAVMLAGAGIQSIVQVRTRNIVLAAALTTALAVSVLYLGAQRDHFGDIRRAALFLKTGTPEGQVVLSDEDPKTSFWSGVKVNFYDPEIDLKPGTWIVLHEFYTDLPAETARLAVRYRLRTVFEDRSRVGLMVPDFASYAAPPPLPAYTARRVFREFKSVILEVKGRRQVP
jgi:hypothetical protein